MARIGHFQFRYRQSAKFLKKLADAVVKFHGKGQIETIPFGTFKIPLPKYTQANLGKLRTAEVAIINLKM